MDYIACAKIRKLREEMGMTQEDLAQSVGLSSEFISHLELGKRSPSLESLSRIARFFNKDMSFFIVKRDESFDNLVKGKELSDKTKRIMKKFKKYCFDYLKLEELTGRQPDLAPLYTNVSAEEMAEQERRRLDLGRAPITNIFSLMELNGLHVWRSPLPEELKISGVFVFMEHKQAAFALVNSSQSLGFQILTAAHEYAHYLKDRYDGPIIDNPDIFIEDYVTLYPGREKFAQIFAVNFLVPVDKVTEIMKKDIRTKQPNFEDILYLKRYFNAGLLAINQVLKKMDYISLSRFKDIQKMNGGAYQKILPSSTAMTTVARRAKRAVVSERFACLAVDACRMNKISIEKAAKLSHIKKEQLALLIKK